MSKSIDEAKKRLLKDYERHLPELEAQIKRGAQALQHFSPEPIADDVAQLIYLEAKYAYIDSNFNYTALEDYLLKRELISDRSGRDFAYWLTLERFNPELDSQLNITALREDEENAFGGELSEEFLDMVKAQYDDFVAKYNAGEDPELF